MKVAIITLYDANGGNYGNHLQTYALNRYLNSCDLIEAITLQLDRLFLASNFVITSRNWLLASLYKYRSILKLRFSNNTTTNEMLTSFCRFGEEHIRLSVLIKSWKQIENLDCDAFIVGSDVVWIQNKYGYNRIRFLDFEAKHRLSYAASFGRDWIPENNKNAIKKCLDRFDYVSVREKSSIQLLSEIGINARHVVDPTLLLDTEEWRELEIHPKTIDYRYWFVYLLSPTEAYMNMLESLADVYGTKLVIATQAIDMGNIGHYQIVDTKYKIEEWLWLVDNADFVITDSFHGIVFSALFNTRFFALDRVNGKGINNRVLDFLSTIRCSNKYKSKLSIDDFRNEGWDFESINQIVNNVKKSSSEYLTDYLGSLTHESE